MTDFQFSHPFDKDKLLSQIAEAQEVWADCYLVSPDRKFAVHIRPTDSPLISVRQFEISDTISLRDVNFSFREPDYVQLILSEGSIFCGGEVSIDDFKEVFENTPLETVPSLQYLANIFEEYFGSSRDSRIWSAFIEHLDQTVSDATVDRLIVPLLEAGDLDKTPDLVQSYLQSRGWSDKEIESKYDLKKRVIRESRAEFFKITGTVIERIKSSNDFADAIIAALTPPNSGSEFAAIDAICHFIKAQPSHLEMREVKAIVFPLFSLFGLSAYERFSETLYDMYDDHRIDYSPFPDYEPLLPPYRKWWEERGAEFSKFYGTSINEVAETEDLVEIILSQAEKSKYLNMMLSSIVEDFIAAQSSYANIDRLRTIIEPLIPYIGKHGYSGLKYSIEDRGWASRWHTTSPEPVSEIGNPWGDWEGFYSAFGKR